MSFGTVKTSPELQSQAEYTVPEVICFKTIARLVRRTFVKPSQYFIVGKSGLTYNNIRLNLCLAFDRRTGYKTILRNVTWRL